MKDITIDISLLFAAVGVVAGWLGLAFGAFVLWLKAVAFLCRRTRYDRG